MFGTRVVGEGMGRGNGESMTTNRMIMTRRPTNVTKPNQYPAVIAHHRSMHVPICLEARVHTHALPWTHSRVRIRTREQQHVFFFFTNTRNLCWVCASIHAFRQDHCAYCTEPAYMQWKHACSHACSSVHVPQIGTHVCWRWCACQSG